MFKASLVCISSSRTAKAILLKACLKQKDRNKQKKEREREKRLTPKRKQEKRKRRETKGSSKHKGNCLTSKSVWLGMKRGNGDGGGHWQ